MRYLGISGINDDELIFCPSPSKSENGELIFTINYQNSKT